ncbi:unnamed protein product [Calypogeia fissa]
MRRVKNQSMLPTIFECTEEEGEYDYRHRHCSSEQGQTRMVKGSGRLIVGDEGMLSGVVGHRDHDHDGHEYIIAMAPHSKKNGEDGGSAGNGRHWTYKKVLLLVLGLVGVGVLLAK